MCLFHKQYETPCKQLKAELYKITNAHDYSCKWYERLFSIANANLEFFVVLGLCVHLNFNCINFQKLSSFLMVICAILSLTRSVKFLKDLTDYNKSLNYLILVDTNRYKQIFFYLSLKVRYTIAPKIKKNTLPYSSDHIPQCQKKSYKASNLS